MTSAPYERPGIYITESLEPLTGNNFIPGEAVGCFASAFSQGPTVPTFVKSWSQYTQFYGGFSTANGSALHYAVYQFFQQGGTGAYILRMPNSDATTATLNLQDVNSPPDNVLTVNAYSPGKWANNVYVAVTSAGNAGRFNLSVYNSGTAQVNLVESFIDLSINPADSRNVVSIVNSTISGSNYIQVVPTLPGAYESGVSDPALLSPTPLAGGADGVTSPSISTIIPIMLDTLQGQIINLNVPGVSDVTTINDLISWAEGRGDVMLVVDGPAPNPPETSADVVANYIGMITGGSSITSSTYCTIYAPYILVTDPASSLPGATVWLPPGGAVLGVWSRTDNAVGPHQSPAGVSYGRLNVLDFEVRFTNSDLDTLNVNNINALRFVPGYFPAIMGARTLEQGYPDRYIAVRRELIKLEHDFTYLLQFALFEPNDPHLWAAVTNCVTTYLTQQLQAQVFGGSTPADSFSVICDDTNNLPATAQAGILNCAVAVSLLSPAEYILINISQFQNTGTTQTTTTTSA